MTGFQNYNQLSFVASRALTVYEKECLFRFNELYDFTMNCEVTYYVYLKRLVSFMDNILNNKQSYDILIRENVAIYEYETYYSVYEMIEDMMNHPFSFFTSNQFLEDNETSNEDIEDMTEDVLTRINIYRSSSGVYNDNIDNENLNPAEDYENANLNPVED